MDLAVCCPRKAVKSLTHLPCPLSGISSEMPTSAVQLPIPNLQSYFNTPVSTLTVAQNNNVQSNYDFLNSSGGACLSNP